jgi:segregation and condensation protein A
MGTTILLKEERFEGPLDTLLQLIEKDKLDISKISLAYVTKQYVTYVQNLEEKLHFNELMFFVDIASKLIVLKSRLLLPYLEVQEEDEADELIEQLKVYQHVLEKARDLSKLFYTNENPLIANKPRVKTERKSIEYFLKGITPQTLENSMRRCIEKNSHPVPTQKTIKRIHTIEDTIERIQKHLQKLSSFKFHSLLGDSNSKGEIIVSFLALLELAKLATVRLEQEKNFKPIHVYST